ncbi:MAG: phage terminase large subunit [Bryobacteraceae bacterium]|nr:phage terminase large subunit [Bryobacteraceae bacterium]
MLQLSDWACRALAPLEPAPHHRLLMQELMRLESGESDRLMVLMPPGSAKSTYVSVLFPAWWLHRRPRSAIIAVSHTADLSEHFGRQVRRLAGEHQEALGYRLLAGERAAGRWSTDQGGSYFATGVRGPITGRRADLVVIDDPIKSHSEADSIAYRDHVWDWYRSDLITRLRPGGRIVLVMTRWHPDDLGGRLLESGDRWRVLRLPAMAEADDPLGRAPGEALWPDWEDGEALERKRQMVGSRVWAALFQQSPRQSGGVLFPAQRIDASEAAPADVREVRAWDLAATPAGLGHDPDWTVGLKLAREVSGKYIVTDLVRLRGGPHEVEEAILATAHRDGRNVLIGLPQDPGQAGKHQVSWLVSRLAGYRVSASIESGAKLTRALPVAAQAEAGNLRVVRAAWNREFIDELRDFPHGRHDDQVDALSRAFTLLTVAPAPPRRANISILGR